MKWQNIQPFVTENKRPEHILSSSQKPDKQGLTLGNQVENNTLIREKPLPPLKLAGQATVYK